MKRLLLFLALFTLLAAPALAETPDECAARLDRDIAITSYEEAAGWWAQVEKECAAEPAVTATYDPSKPFTAIYGWSDSLVFCVMSPTLNVRSSAGGNVIGSFEKGTLFTVDLGSQELANGFVWAKHDQGWSALFRFPVGDSIAEFTYPLSCPSPAPTPRMTPTPARPLHDVIQLGQTKNFHLSGADCAITASRGTSIEAGKLYIAVGRLGWLKDEFIVVMGFYTIEVHTYTESKKFALSVNSKATYNIAVACE